MNFKISQFVFNSLSKCTINLTSIFRGIRTTGCGYKDNSGFKPLLRRLLFPFPFFTLTLPLSLVPLVKCQTLDGNGNDKPKTTAYGRPIPSCNPDPCTKPFTIDALPCPPCGDNSEAPAPAPAPAPPKVSSNEYFRSQLDKVETVTSVLGLTEQQCPDAGDPIELTHEFLLKQACSINNDSVARILSETISTLDDYHQQYRQMIRVCMDILEESRVSGSELSQELLTCKMIVLRSSMNDIKKSVLEIESFLSSVEKLAYASVEVAYLARAEYPSISLSERIQSALLQAKRIKDQTRELERDLIDLQSVIIVETGNSLK